MNENQVKILVLWISTGLKVLSARLVLLLTLAMTFALFCWGCYDPTWQRIACVTVFAILVYLPIVKLDSGQSKERAIVSPQENTNG
jgi:hypothetical protein